MPVADENHKESDVLASALFTELTAGTDFSLPAVDLDAAEFAIPDEAGNALYTDVDKLTQEDLTTKVIDGEGMFDGLMTALNAHLVKEYERGRLTGAQYAETYVQLTTAAMGQAVQYLLAKDQAYWQAQLAQKQARTAEIATITARLGLETSKAQLVGARADTETAKVNYALTKLKLATEDMNYTLMVSQREQTDYQTDHILPAQKAQTEKETERLNYEIVNILPKEVDRVQKQIDGLTAEISFTTAKKDQALYQTANILPAQKSEIDKDIAIKAYQLSDLLPAQVAGLTADNLAKDYNVNNLLPEQLNSLREQTEAHRAKTMDTRTDGVTVIRGAIGKQKDLHTQQVDSYKRDAEQKIGKMFLDTWITQKSIDEGLNPPTSITDVNINTVMTKIRQNTGLD